MDNYSGCSTDCGWHTRRCICKTKFEFEGYGTASIEFTFGLDEFTFMKHTLSEGDRMSAIMMENNIGMANSVNDTRDYFVYYADNMKAQVLMCPYEIDGDRNYRASVYIVSKESEMTEEST